MMAVYAGEIHNGTVLLPPDCPLREGQRVQVVPLEESPAPSPSDDLPLPLDEKHPACGMWADRVEMADSVSYSRALRESLSRRNGHG
jgi:hypothetical protein